MLLLCKIDEKIELNSVINNNLFEQAKALFKNWFIDYEPFSTDNTIPETWRMGTVGEIIELHDSKCIPLSGSERDKMEKIYPYYGATSLMDYVDNYLFDGIYLLLGEDGTVVDDIIQPIFAEIRNLRSENQRLSSIRDSILPKLMSGDIDVSEVDI